MNTLKKIKTTSGTDTRFVDPLSLQSLNIGDRVTVHGPSGAIVDFKIKSINEDDVIVLGPLSDKTHKPIASLREMRVGDVVTIGEKVLAFNSTLNVRADDLVTVTDKNGNRSQLKVYLLYGKDYVLLCRPGTPKLGTIDAFKFAWDLFWRK